MCDIIFGKMEGVYAEGTVKLYRSAASFKARL